MRTLALFCLMSLLALAPIGLSGPMPYGALERAKVGDWKKTMRFRGGERATVLARGNDNSPANLQLTITDAAGNVVTQTQGKNPPNAAMVAAFWYPPRDGEYTIEVRNSGSEVSPIFVTIK
jgi:hypothetical protein